MLAHLHHVGERLGQGLKLAQITRQQVRGLQHEIDKLRSLPPKLNWQIFALAQGMRRT